MRGPPLFLKQPNKASDSQYSKHPMFSFGSFSKTHTGKETKPPHHFRQRSEWLKFLVHVSANIPVPWSIYGMACFFLIIQETLWILLNPFQKAPGSCLSQHGEVLYHHGADLFLNDGGWWSNIRKVTRKYPWNGEARRLLSYSTIIIMYHAKNSSHLYIYIYVHDYIQLETYKRPVNFYTQPPGTLMFKERC